MSLVIAIILSILMPVIQSPLQIGLRITIIALMSAFFLIKARTWFSLMLLLMYVGGMLIALAYFLSLCPNQPMKISSVFLFPYLITLLFVGMRGVKE